MKQLTGKIAVVTGGGSGIGRAISLALAREGCHVAVISMVESEALGVAEEIRTLGVESLAHAVDVTDTAALGRVAGDVKNRFGRVDIIVTSAGIMGERNFVFRTDEAGWRRTIEVNLNGVFYCLKTFLPLMMEQKAGRIINISSVSGKLPAALNADYAASKHGVIGLTKALAIELGLMGMPEITVNAICPGSVDTQMMSGIVDIFTRSGQETPQEFMKERVLSKTIQKRLLTPDEIADMAVFLASDKAKGITGQAINVDGGAVLF